MAERVLIVAVSLTLIFAYANCVQTQNGRIKITIGTASGCGDTVRFIREQLVPAYEKYGNFLDIEFVPWGKTENLGNGTFKCQFGVRDCWANRLHRCVLNHLKGNQKAQLDYMACEFNPPHPAFLQNSYSCALKSGMSILDADYCVNNPDRDTLDADAENAAKEPMSIIYFVPSIVINDNIDVKVQEEARHRLLSVICFALADDPTSGVVGCQI